MELPFQADYAKSNNSICRGCEKYIVKEVLRLAIMLPGTTFDRKVPNWYHYTCFFNEHMPTSDSDISGYEFLKSDDKKLIKDIIESEESPFNETITNILNEEDIRRYKVKNLEVCYSKVGRCKCEVCQKKIDKSEIQILKKVKRKINRVHLECFVDNRRDYGFLESGEELSGYNNLNIQDQGIVNKQLVHLNEKVLGYNNLKLEDKEIVDQFSNPSPAKKLRLTDEYEISNEEEIISFHTNLMHEYRYNLKTYLTKTELRYLLRHNKQKEQRGYDNMLNQACEMLTYGTLGKCLFCNSQLILSNITNSGYTCSGYTNEWTKCSEITINPIRSAVIIPESLKKFEFLMDYKYIPRQKHIQNCNNMKDHLLFKNLMFIIFGLSADEEIKLIEDIKFYGGRVVSEVKRSVLAVVTTPEDFKKRSALISKAEEFGLYIIPQDFFDKIVDHALNDPEEVKKMIKTFDMSGSGTALQDRVPDKFKKNKSTIINNNNIIVKHGLGIEPGADLDQEAHIYIINNNEYTATLTKTDIGINQNSYYKIQLYESDDLTKYWVYREWGRIGVNCGKKLEKMSDLNEAILNFENEFRNKTGNEWAYRKNMKKISGLYSYLEVSYKPSAEEIENLETRIADSKLNPAVAQLIAFIFNVTEMNKALLEYSLDTKKMPLGKLSNKQIWEAYYVLKEVDCLLSDKDITLGDMIKYTNQFYTIIPYNSTLEAPPLLDSMEKTLELRKMLSNLTEIKTAYSIIQINADGEKTNPLDSYYKQLCTDIETLDKTAEEYPIIVQYLQNTHAKIHHQYKLEIMDIFKINRHDEQKRFKKFSNLHNRKLLWHGSLRTNFAGILSQGLRIAPENAQSTGDMFGKGIYFADMVSKSANYSKPAFGQNEGLLLLCEVALGNMLEKMQGNCITVLPSNIHSIKGVGKTEPDPTFDIKLSDGVCVPIGKPVTNYDKKHKLRHNEYIVYDADQVKIRYLLKVKFLPK